MKRRSKHVKVEPMEQRLMLSAAARHVLILSVDGLHQADVADPALQRILTNIRALRRRASPTPTPAPPTRRTPSPARCLT